MFKVGDLVRLTDDAVQDLVGLGLDDGQLAVVTDSGDAPFYVIKLLATGISWWVHDIELEKPDATSE